jgi:hypothetical protein
MFLHKHIRYKTAYIRYPEFRALLSLIQDSCKMAKLLNQNKLSTSLAKVCVNTVLKRYQTVSVTQAPLNHMI